LPLPASNGEDRAFPDNLRPAIPDDATLLRIRLPDRPGGLALLATRLAEHGVDILRLEVVDWRDDVAVDDLLVAGGRLDEALAGLPGDVRVIGRREHGDLPDPGLAMAEACAAVTGAASLGEARRSLLTAALKLVSADGGVVLRDAGHGWLRPLASNVDLPPIKGEPSLAGTALALGRPVVADGEAEWAPPPYRNALRGGSLVAVPAGAPPYLCLLAVRAGAFPFVEAEIERLEALIRVALGTLAGLGERPVREPDAPAVRVRVRGIR
jgi:hypothetical protein